MGGKGARYLLGHESDLLARLGFFFKTTLKGRKIARSLNWVAVEKHDLF